MLTFARVSLVSFLLVGLVCANPNAPQSTYDPPLAKASDEADKAISRFKAQPWMKTEVWAAEPLLAQPVAFCFDEKGRCYVAETFRHSHGTTDNRGHMYWLDDELASRTVADRVAKYKKYAKEKFSEQYEKHRERIRLVEDTDQDGKADRASVFSDRFGRAEDGLGAGLLARRGNVYYTCIPDLWLLKDTQGTGKADMYQSLSTGYGVHTAFIGHDLHGLRMGPDGKLYFSVGDRGFHVTTKEGKKIFHPDTGGVLRCDPDGSNLEVVATGLRNPQELAFDDYGNLFTVDNNSDSGDKARFVYLIEGGDSGWRIGYQYGSSVSNRGPWNYEKLWHPHHDGQPAYIVPPITNFSDGPSGFTHYPGIGLADKYKGHFFLCDFRGNSGGSGVLSFTTKPKGAGFELIGSHQFVWSILATDCEFGPDGAFYISDWVEGWNLNGKGRIYRFSDPEAMKNPAIVEAQKWLAEGFTQRSIEALIPMLGHAHQQIRLEAQYALAEKGSKAIPALTTLAQQKDAKQLARIHAIWGLGQIARRDLSAIKGLMVLAIDADAEIRGQVGKQLATHAEESDLLEVLLKDPEIRVRFQTAVGLSQRGVKAPEAVLPALLQLIEKNADADVYLRHASVMALTRLATVDQLVKNAEHPSAPIRLASCLALRRKAVPEVARFLKDADPKIVSEAARAIMDDETIPAAIPALAEMLGVKALPEPVVFRAMNAHFRLGKQENALAIARYLSRSGVKESLGVMGFEMLADWSKPKRRDAITGGTQSLPERPAELAVEAFRAILAKGLPGTAKVQQTAINAAGKLGIKEIGPKLFEMVAQESNDSAVRLEALKSLDILKDPKRSEAVAIALTAKDANLRSVARSILIRTEPDKAIPALKKTLQSGEQPERQSALYDLASIKSKEANALLEEWLDQLIAQKAPPELQLDIWEAVQKVKSPSIQEKVKKYRAAQDSKTELGLTRLALAGGNAERGKDLFYNHAASCQRCHKYDNEGGEVGPALNGIAKEKNREYLLESIVLPNKQIAKGFESVLIVTMEGRSVSGIIREETPKQLKLINAEGTILTIPTDQIEDRRPSKSAMPDDLMQKLSLPELRDLIEFMAGLKS